MFFLLLLFLPLCVPAADPADNEWVHLPSKCEVCKYVAVELKSSFDETSRTGELIETRYDFLDEDKKKKKIKYTKSYIRLIEVMESICPRLLEYNLHKERTGSNRFAKGMSETFQTLHNLVHKGVKVVMDIPYELWNETSAEVADMKKQCDVLLEEYEDVIEDWYHHHQEEDLTEFLCARHVLQEHDKSCLSEEWRNRKGDNAPSNSKKKQKKGGGKKRKKSKKDAEQEMSQITGEQDTPERQTPTNRAKEEL